MAVQQLDMRSACLNMLTQASDQLGRIYTNLLQGERMEGTAHPQVLCCKMLVPPAARVQHSAAKKTAVTMRAITCKVSRGPCNTMA